jgi:hypothetical protein
MKETYYNFEDVKEEDKDNFELFTDNEGPVCPHCGYEEKEPESVPYQEGETTQHCGSCLETFICDTWVSTSWTTSKVEGLTENE